MTELNKLINRLTNVDRKDEIVKHIKDLDGLINALTELREIIGNNRIKDSIVSRINTLLVQRSRDHPFMENIIIYGPPGTGKTQIGKQIAKILYCLGVIDGKEEENLSPGVTKKMTNILENLNPNTIYIIIVVIAIIWSLLSASVIWIYDKLGSLYFYTLLVIMVLVLLFFLWIYGDTIISSLNNDTTIVDNNVSSEKKKKNYDNIITVVSREDFVDKYMGWTDKKTKKLLTDNLGKVLFVDEAYSLYQGHYDQYGREAIDTLNRFMSENPGKIVVIFAGYKDKMADVFRLQKGLKRRFTWQFESEKYNADELFAIFELQAKRINWELHNRIETKKLFSKYADAFPNYGGDTERLLDFSIQEYSNEYMNGKKLEENVLFTIHIDKGIKLLLANNIEEEDQRDADTTVTEDFIRRFKSSFA